MRVDVKPLFSGSCNHSSFTNGSGTDERGLGQHSSQIVLHALVLLNGGGAALSWFLGTGAEQVVRLGNAAPWRGSPQGLLLYFVITTHEGMAEEVIPMATLIPQDFGTSPAAFGFWNTQQSRRAGIPTTFLFDSYTRNAWYQWSLRYRYAPGLVTGLTNTRTFSPVYGGRREQDFKIRVKNQPHLPLLLGQ